MLQTNAMLILVFILFSFPDIGVAAFYHHLLKNYLLNLMHQHWRCRKRIRNCHCSQGAHSLERKKKLTIKS